MKQLKLEVLFGGKNQLSPALKAILGSSNAASAALKKTKDEIKSLNNQQKKIDGYNKQKKAVQDQSKALNDLQVKIKSLRQQMQTNPSDALTKEFNQSVKKAQSLKQQFERNRVELQRMRTELHSSGLSTNRLADHQVRLRTQLGQANKAMLEQEQRLKRMRTLQDGYQNSISKARSTAMYGAGAAASGVGALYLMNRPISESKRVDVEGNRIYALGLGDKVSQDAIKFAQGMKTFGTSIHDNMELMRDGITVFSDLHHAEMVAPTLAKMKFSNKAMFGHEKGEENERVFMDMLKVIELRGGLKDEKAFLDQANKIQQVIAATGGRVQANEWLNAIKTGGIAVKGQSDEALYYKMESIVQEWGGFRYGTAAMSAYQNIYQGRTTKRAANNMQRLGLIEDPSKLKHDKAGQIAFLDVGAIKGADLFRKDQFAWMEEVLLPQLAKKGITTKDQVLDTIGSIFTNRTASNLFGDMYLQRDIINKSAKMNAGADNIDKLYDKATNTAAGKELEAKAKLHDAYLRFGETILPVYSSALEYAASAFQKFTGWMEQNPTYAKAFGVGLIAIAASLVAIGGALVVFSPLILSMLSLRLIMASTAAGGSAMGKAFSKIPSVFGVLKAAFLGVGRAFLWLGRLLLANPIVLAITAIATAAYLIYKNWDSLKPFFIGLWTSVKAIFKTAGSAISNIFQSMWGGLATFVGGIWNKVKAVFQSGIDFVKGIIQSVDKTFADNPLLTVLFPFIGIPRVIIANWSSISGFFAQIWNTVTNIITANVTAIGNFISTGFTAITSFFTAVWTVASNFISVIWQGISSTISTSVTFIFTVISTVFNSVKNYLSGVWNTVKLIVSSAWKGICTVFAVISPLPYIKAAFQTVFDFLAGLYGRMMSLGLNIIQGLTDGIKSGFQKLKSTWTDINNFMPDFMKKRMDIHSPSRVMAALGGHIISGLGVGLDKNFPHLRDQFARVITLFNPNLNPTAAMIDVIPMLKIDQNLPDLKARFEPFLKVFQPITNAVAATVDVIPALNIDKNFPELKAKFEHVLKLFNPDLAAAISKIDVTPALNKVKPTPSISPPSKSNHFSIEGDTITIHIPQVPGQSMQQLEAMLENMLNRREQQKFARARSQFRDQE
ncbi:phage tail tape measure protein, TP901 family, core region [Acinetobacter vivianii]|uniref:Phage tail tape measure protein, TP901 family, core region n=1 Tax=Acinetobacter vivianii TaxID=1776742 RepID=N8WC46_9GAMM|nr:phage tail tape measure protein [Acinetobacter vivianii]ENU92509.1 phage tail tape measure protein, TP901 family, core region [Acinetobacter vivianii]